MSSGVLKRRLCLEDLVTSKAKRQRCDELQYLNPTGQRNLDPFLLECPRDEFPSKRKQLSIPGLLESNAVENNSSSLGKRTEEPLFTFDQVMLICGQKLKDCEQETLTKYEDFLKRKSAEQYDTFVKFTIDQIQQNYETPSSFYLS